jgi:hypothetical protein
MKDQRSGVMQFKLEEFLNDDFQQLKQVSQKHVFHQNLGQMLLLIQNPFLMSLFQKAYLLIHVMIFEI